MPISYSSEAANFTYLGSSNDKPVSQWAPHDRKEEMIMKLVPRARELQNQLQEWTEWANQKVMQAARRLGKDKAELKTLRQEKEEVERLKKEKQTLEENTMKKLSEMENALSKASGQVDRANSAVRRLEVENVFLRREMEAARLRAAESAASYMEVSKREKKTLIKFQSWEKNKTVLQEDLSAEKLKLIQMQQKLKQCKDIRDQAEAKLNQEVKAKEEILRQANSYKKEREQIEASTKSKESAMKSRAEANLQKSKEDIERLEKEISQLRLKPTPRNSRPQKGRSGHDLRSNWSTLEIQYTQQRRHNNISAYIFKIVAGSTTRHVSGRETGERVRDVLVPRRCPWYFSRARTRWCALCATILHEKQGMKDCPFLAGGPIQRRVCVRYAHS
ncbi:hypothetical protein MIMGU_mgv1a007976mg [Erythranthe guttata]|uniref:Uncharacterized protein n=1 Tax=Erythranthe guttata TaxID=4155 RepID=A0A022RTL8_ERYGU|nr:hypothetical protein MIMGU_mgv1a007976mg [Erythranthe guttata]